MNEAEMKERTKHFALHVQNLADNLPKTRKGDILASQIMRSGTSVAANYRALCRAKSRPDFINKTSIVEEEADETAWWLELIAQDGLIPSGRVQPFLQEANELTGIMVASRRTSRERGKTIEDRKPKTENQ
jgi:four helix bundle protein